MIRLKAENPLEWIVDTFGRDSSMLGCHPYRKSGKRYKCHTRRMQLPQTLASMRREFAVKRILCYFCVRRLIVADIARGN